MSNPAKNLLGQKFGYLTVVSREGSTINHRAAWLCRCECGNEVVRESQYLRDKRRKYPRHCGCKPISKTTHGRRKNDRMYRIWCHMRERCYRPSSNHYDDYGGRGIVVCSEWRHSFEAFVADMEPSYQPDLTLGRIDNDGPYSKENCRWETQIQQHNNKRSNVLIETPKGRMTVSQAARLYGLKVVTLHARIFRYGWDVERALTTLPYADRGRGS